MSNLNTFDLAKLISTNNVGDLNNDADDIISTINIDDGCSGLGKSAVCTGVSCLRCPINNDNGLESIQRFFKSLKGYKPKDSTSIESNDELKIGDWVVVTSVLTKTAYIQTGQILKLVQIDKDRQPYGCKDITHSYHWGGKDYIQFAVDVRKATQEEIDSVTKPKDPMLDLLEEAKRKYPVGTKFINHIFSDGIRVVRNGVFLEKGNTGNIHDKSPESGNYVYYEGKWAEIVQNDEEEVTSQESKPNFIVGRWYKNLGSIGNWYGKYCEGDSLFPCSEYITNTKTYHNTECSFSFYENAVLLEDLSEIQQYLPDGHPDKIVTSEINRDGYYEVSSQEEYEALNKWLKSKGEKVDRNYKVTGNWHYVYYRKKNNTWELNDTKTSIELPLPDLSEFLSKQTTEPNTSKSTEMYVVKQSDLIGELEGFPIEVVQKMVERQVEQKNEADVRVFQKILETGFLWSESVEGWDFWNDVIPNRNFDTFFKRYPKSTDSVITDQPITEQFDVVCIKKVIGFTVGKHYKFPNPIDDNGNIRSFFTTLNSYGVNQHFKKVDDVPSFAEPMCVEPEYPTPDTSHVSESSFITVEQLNSKPVIF